ncbi:hypothetical protein [Dietzia sp.]|uniref:hypothetical protein n=1 Tax=Dietzia sp. TaxID=1871616 RepID=UPI002FD8DC3D
MAVDLELLFRPAKRPDLFEDLLLPVGENGQPDAGGRESWSIPVPEVLRDPSPEAVGAAIAAGGGVSLDLWTLGAADAADIVIAVAHAGVGFGPGLQVPAENAEQAWTLLSLAVAAMIGEDVRAEWEACAGGNSGPGEERRAKIGGLGRAAREAIRDVITVIPVPADAAASIEATFPELA